MTAQRFFAATVPVVMLFALGLPTMQGAIPTDFSNLALWLDATDGTTLTSNSGLANVGDQVRWAPFVQQLGIIESQRPLCGRMLEMMADEGWLDGRDGAWKVSTPLPPPIPSEQIADSLIARVPECDNEISLLMQCGKSLSNVLSGDVDPLQILFPDGSSQLLENLYSESPFARSLNTLVEESIVRAVRDRPAHRPLFA